MTGMPLSRCSTSTRLVVQEALNSQSSGGRSIRNPAASRLPRGLLDGRSAPPDRRRASAPGRRAPTARSCRPARRHARRPSAPRGTLQRATRARLLVRLGRRLGSDDGYLLSMRLATFNILHGRVAERRGGRSRRLADAVRIAGSRHPRAAGGRPATAPLPTRRPDGGGRRGDGGGDPPVRRRAVRHARARPGSPPPRAMCRAPPRTGSRCCRATPPGPGRCCACRGSRCASRSTCRAAQGDHGARGAAGGGDRPARHPRRPAGGGQHAPVVRARLGTSAAACGSGATWRRSSGPVLLMGDLNMAGRCRARITGYRSLAQHPTFPLDHPDRQLDHILLRGRLGRVPAAARPRCRCPITGRWWSTSILTGKSGGKG